MSGERCTPGFGLRDLQQSSVSVTKSEMCLVAGSPQSSVTPRQAEACVCVCLCVLLYVSKTMCNGLREPEAPTPSHTAVVEYWSLNPVSGFYSLL